MSRRIGWALVALGLVTSCAPVAPTTGILRGTLAVPSSSRPQDAVVWLEKAPDSIPSSRPSRGAIVTRPPLPSIVTRNQQFDPRLVVLAAGDTLTFRNDDRVWHGPFSVSPERRFELGKQAPGHLDSLVFPNPGQVQVRCDIHPGMSATVLVLPNHHFARPNAAGEWQLPKLPQGAYVLRAWAPGLKELRQDVSFSARADTVLDLRW